MSEEQDKQTVEPKAPEQTVTDPAPEAATTNVQPQGQPPVDNTGFDQPEYTRKMQERARLLEEKKALDAKAVERGFDNHQEYLEHLEAKATEYDEALAAYEQDGSESGVTKKELEALRKEVAATREQNVTMMMNFQYDSYSKMQSSLDKDKQYGFSKAEIDKFLLDPETGASVARVAKQAGSDGTPNFYVIAARMMNRERSEAELLKKGADTQAAIDKEMDATKTMDSVAAPPGKGKKTAAQEEADRLAPDRRKKF
jgi:hypothetical protein